MATRRGDEIAVPAQPETDLALAGKPLSGLEDVEAELGLDAPHWQEAAPDYTPMPGGKHYLETKPQAKHGSPTHVVVSNNKIVR
jgi:hypothetical protein